MMADIFNNLDRASEARILTALDERNRDSAERIRALMFTFEDLTRLDPAGVQALQRAVEKERLTLALKGASEEIRNLFLSNMSQRAGRMLREDIAGLGPVRLRDVDEAQAAIVVLVKEMAGRGEVRLGDNRDDPLIT
jgi:flagellar motor switch protein FliG